MAITSKAPINHACKVEKIVEIRDNKDLYIGHVIETYISEDCLTKEIPDFAKINPLIFSTSNRIYWSLEKEVGRAWKIGRNYKNLI